MIDVRQEISAAVDRLEAELRFARADNDRLKGDNRKLGENVERLIAEREQLNAQVDSLSCATPEPVQPCACAPDALAAIIHDFSAFAKALRAEPTDDSQKSCAEGVEWAIAVIRQRLP